MVSYHLVKILFLNDFFLIILLFKSQNTFPSLASPTRPSTSRRSCSSTKKLESTTASSIVPKRFVLDWKLKI